MRNSRHVVASLSFGFLLTMIFGTAAFSHESAAAGPAQPSRESSTVADSLSAAEPTQPTTDETTSASPSQPSAATASLASPQATTKTTPAGGPNPFGSSDDELHDKKWHYYATGYLWIPGIHGTIGVRGFDASIHVSGSEIFTNFRGGLLGVFTPTYNRFSAPVDYMWMRLRDSKAIPFQPDYSVRATLNMSIITPKVNYLAVNNPKFKIYGTAGARVWHVGTTLSLVPVIVGYFPYKGVTWTDYVMGARFSVPLGSKASVDVLGDGGEGGATLDYQVAGILNYQLTPKLTAQAGWRYLTEHYGNNGNVMNTTIQGILFGATYKFK